MTISLSQIPANLGKTRQSLVMVLNSGLRQRLVRWMKALPSMSGIGVRGGVSPALTCCWGVAQHLPLPPAPAGTFPFRASQALGSRIAPLQAPLPPSRCRGCSRTTQSGESLLYRKCKSCLAFAMEMKEKIFHRCKQVQEGREEQERAVHIHNGVTFPNIIFFFNVVFFLIITTYN